MKRKADGAHDSTRSHTERCRLATKDHMLAEEVLNNSLGSMGHLVKDTAGATHVLTWGVPDRESIAGPLPPRSDRYDRRIPKARLSKPVVKPADGDQPCRKTTWARHGLRCKARPRPWVRRMGAERKHHLFFILTLNSSNSWESDVTHTRYICDT